MSRPRSIEVIEKAAFVTISELVQLSLMRYSTLKYYTEEGFLPFEQSESRRVRRYPRLEVLKRIEEIKKLKKSGFSIDEIRNILLNK